MAAWLGALGKGLGGLTGGLGIIGKSGGKGLFGKNPLTATAAQAPFAPSPGSEAKINPEARAAQSNALARLGQVSQQGFTAEDKQALQKGQDEENMFANQRLKGAQDDLAKRGLANSGAAISLQAQAGQDTNQRAAQRGYDISQLGRQRALQAMGMMGQAGGMINQEDLRSQGMHDQANQFASHQLNNYLGNNAEWKNRMNMYNTDFRRQLGGQLFRAAGSAGMGM